MKNPGIFCLILLAAFLFHVPRPFAVAFWGTIITTGLWLISALVASQSRPRAAA